MRQHKVRNIAACDSLNVANNFGRNVLEIQLEIKGSIVKHIGVASL